MSVDRLCKRESPESYPKDMDFPIKKGLHTYTEEGVKLLQSKYPDVKLCTSLTCEFTNFDHEISYKYVQHNKNMAKQGMIRVLHKVGSTGDVELDWNSDTNRIFEWYNGKKWIELTQ